MKDGRFVSIEDFRKNAKESDFEELWNLYQSGVKNFPTKEEPKPECKFQFSASAAKGELDKWMEEKESSSKELKIDGHKKEFEKHSIEVTHEQWEKLQAIYDRYSDRKKQYVLHALLEETLNKYAPKEI